MITPSTPDTMEQGFPPTPPATDAGSTDRQYLSGSADFVSQYHTRPWHSKKRDFIRKTGPFDLDLALRSRAKLVRERENLYSSLAYQDSQAVLLIDQVAFLENTLKQQQAYTVQGPHRKADLLTNIVRQKKFLRTVYKDEHFILQGLARLAFKIHDQDRWIKAYYTAVTTLFGWYGKQFPQQNSYSAQPTYHDYTKTAHDQAYCAAPTDQYDYGYAWQLPDLSAPTIVLTVSPSSNSSGLNPNAATFIPATETIPFEATRRSEVPIPFPISQEYADKYWEERAQNNTMVGPQSAPYQANAKDKNAGEFADAQPGPTVYED
jgi:hypothetical protein